MGNLGDQLRKANLISKKDQKRLQHESRVDRKTKGRETLEREERSRREELEGQRAVKRDSDRARQKVRESERQGAEERAACEQLLADDVRVPVGRGHGWHFELEDGALPSLNVSEAERVQLRSGHLCIARTGAPGTHTYGLIASGHADRIAAVFPERIVWRA